MSLERFLRSRYSRWAFALILIGVSAWAFAPYILYRVASSAFVNASLTRITAPIPGRLAETLPKPGDLLDQPLSVPLIEALSPDRSHLLDLQRQHVLAKRNSELVDSQLEEISALDKTMSKRVKTYHDGSVKRLEREIAETKAEREGCLAELKQLRIVGSIMQNLTKSGLASEIRYADALAKEQAVSTRCNVADARLSRLAVEVEAARDGVFLRDGMNDVPYSEQQRDRLVLRRQELETEILKENLRASELSAAIEAERVRIQRATNYQLKFPAGHVVWSMEASPGSSVTEGQTILHLADCNRRFLAVELPERDFESIKTTDTALVRLIGDQTWYRGSVLQVRGSAARADDRLLAAQLSNIGQDKITIELKLPPEALPIASSTYCGIGRLAEVRFPRAPLAFMTGLTNAWRSVAEFFSSTDVKQIAGK